MSFDIIADLKLNWAERLAMVALNIAASITPISPCGRNVRLAATYDASFGLARCGQIACRSGYTIRIAIGGMNQRNAPTKKSPQHSSAAFLAARSFSTLK